MAELRLIDRTAPPFGGAAREGSLAIVALAACAIAGGDARADGPPAPPASWRALPKVAAAIADGAKADGVAIEASLAWGDPARGCFATWLALRGSGPATADQVVSSLAGMQLHDVVASAGAVALAFQRAPFRGVLRATLDGDAVRALACFGDGREPVACEAACATMIGGASR